MSQDSLFYQKCRLIAKLTKTDLNQVLINSPQLSNKHQVKLDQYIELLNSGYPLDYLLGEIQFLELRILLNDQVLIPREETEWWVQSLQKHLKKDSQQYKNHVLVDIGCGSGVIGLSLCQYFQELWSSDIDKNVLALVSKNTAINRLDRPRLILADLIDSRAFSQLKYKKWVLVSNLPYLPDTDKVIAVESKVNFEPTKALYSGSDGLDLFKKLCEQLITRFGSNLPTVIYLELDPRNIQEAKLILDKIFDSTEIWEDLNGNKRLLVGWNTSNISNNPIES